MAKQKIATEKFGWPPLDWSRAVGCGLTKTYELKNQGKIEFVKLGAKKTLITTHPADFLASLAAEQGDAAPLMIKSTPAGTGPPFTKQIRLGPRRAAGDEAEIDDRQAERKSTP